jgi:hypothetical protein
VKDVERAKENYLVAVELGDVDAMVCVGELLDQDDPQRFFWFGRAATNGDPSSFCNEMSDHMRNFSSGTGEEKIVFAIGRALKGQIDNEKRAIFGNPNSFDVYIEPANQALHFYNF